MTNGIIGIESRMVEVFQVVADLFTHRLTKRSDVAEVRRALVASVDMLMREVDLPSAVLTDSGLWFPADMTADEKVALAGDLHPALRKRLSTRVWKGLALRSQERRQWPVGCSLHLPLLTPSPKEVRP